MRHQAYNDDTDEFISEIEDKVYNSAKFLAENEVPKGYIKIQKHKASRSLKLKRFLARYVPVALLHVLFAVGAFVAAYVISYDKETQIINPVAGLVFSFIFLMTGQTICSVLSMTYLNMISGFERQR